jgi:hypothetical protein
MLQQALLRSSYFLRMLTERMPAAMAQQTRRCNHATHMTLLASRRTHSFFSSILLLLFFFFNIFFVACG